MEQKKFFTLGKMLTGVVILALLWFVIKILFPVGGAVVGIEATEKSVSRAGSGSYLDVESPVQLGKIVHINSVNMLEPGFIVVYRREGTSKFFGATELLQKGKKENFDVVLSEEVKCTDLQVTLSKDLNGDGKFGWMDEGEEAKANMNGEARIMNPDFPNLSITQSVLVKCK